MTTDLPDGFMESAIDARAEAGRPIRICFPFSGDSIGGSHVSVRGLLDELDPARFRPVIVPEIPDGRIATMFAGMDQLADPVSEGPGFVPGQAFGTRKMLQTFGGVGRRTRFLRDHAFDLVHVNDGRTSANWSVATRLARLPLVWHHRGDPGALGLRLAAPLLANRVVTVSSFALPAPGIWSAAGKAEVIHSPFDTSLTIDRGEARAALADDVGLSPDTVVIGFVGSFVPRKRPLVFVDAAVALQAMLDRPVLGVMFGEARVPAMAEGLAAHIERTAPAGLIRMMGHRTPGAFWIAACDQLVVPAVNEPFGRTLIEAMLVGTPVVAAASGGNVEALRDGSGVLVRPDDPLAFAYACAELATDATAARTLAAQARTNARSRFSAVRHAASIAQVYHQLVKAGACG